MNINLFTPHLGQRRVIDGFADSKHKFCTVATGRQFGKSLLGQNLMLYWLLSNKNQTGGWISPIYNQAKKVFQELSNAAHSIIDSSNKADLTIKFINGSTLQFLSAERYDSIRGFSFNYMVIDEAAFIREEALNEAILPTLSATGKKCLIISTPKSKNWFYSYYLRGKEENDVYVSYDGISIDNPHVDQNFIEEQKKSLPLDIYRQEYLAAFTDAGSDVFTNVDAVCLINEFSEGYRSGNSYFAGVDLGLSNDYSVLTIMDQVGRVHHIERINGTSYADITKTFAGIIQRFKVKGGFVEVNGPGQPVFESLRNHNKKLKPFVTTNETKNSGIRSLIYDIQQGDIMLPSKELFPPLYNELNAYTYKVLTSGKIQFTHPNGLNDDCVMSLMIANEARDKFGKSGGGLYVGGSVSRKNIHPSSGLR